MIRMVLTWLPLLGVLPLLVAALYLLICTLVRPAFPYEFDEDDDWDDDDWTAQSEVGW